MVVFSTIFLGSVCEANVELSMYLRTGDCYGALEVDLSKENTIDDVYRVALGRCLIKTQQPKSIGDACSCVSGLYGATKTLYMVQAYEQLGEISTALEVLSTVGSDDPTLQLMQAKIAS